MSATDARLLQIDFESATEGILIVDELGTLQTGNPAVEKLFGYSAAEFQDVRLAGLIPCPFAEMPAGATGSFAERASGAEGPNHEAQGRHKSGRTIPLWLSIQPAGFNGEACHSIIVRDLTLQKAYDARNIQDQRLAAICELSSGLAHESRNALQRSQSCLELLAFETHDRPKALELIERIQRAQDHLLELYEEIRGYSAPMKLKPTNVALDEVMQASWNELQTLQVDGAPRLKTRPTSMDLHCDADRDRIVHMFKGLLKNSIESAGAQGWVEVQWTEAEIDGQRAVTATIRDDGPGVAPEFVSKLFRPFFTTKTRGMGLSLAISQRIAEAHGGRIVFVPESSRGARMDITLPRKQFA